MNTFLGHFLLLWPLWLLQMVDSDTLAITLRAKDIGEMGMLAIGWGGTTMADAEVC